MRDDFKLDFEEFMNADESPPERLFLKVKKDLAFSLRKRSILSRFILFQMLGALITLTFCPQFGIGLAEGHGIAHYFRGIGDWACAAFCGSLFLLSGTFIASLSMGSDQTYWIWTRYKFPLIILPTVTWMLLMTINLSFKFPSETLSYNLAWVVSAILMQQLFLKIRNLNYQGVLKSS